MKLIIFAIIFALSTSATGDAWYNKIQVKEFSEGVWQNNKTELVKFCPNNNKNTQVPLEDDCTSFLFCDWTQIKDPIKKSRILIVSKKQCEKCPESATKNTDCPNGFFIHYKQKCTHPKDVYVADNKCGTKENKKGQTKQDGRGFLPFIKFSSNKKGKKPPPKKGTTESSIKGGKNEEITTESGTEGGKNDETTETAVEGGKNEEETKENAKEGETEDGNGKCAATGDYHRLGKSNFYVFQNAKRTKQVNWFGAKKICETAGFKLAKIDNIQTEVLVGRELEKWIMTNGWIDNWYWLNAKFDRKSKTYKWQDTMESLNFTNFLYRSPRPKGYGDFFDVHGKFIDKPKDEHCLAQSMPLSFPKLDKYKAGVTGKEGFGTGWWERICNSKLKGNVICESEDPICSTERELSVFTESDGSYYEEFWPMSNRRFVVHWTPRNYKEATLLCEEMGLEIYSPHEDDKCLSANLKTWMPGVTTYSFWTNVELNVKNKKFLHTDGTEVAKSTKNSTLKLKREAKNTIDKTCASISWHFEDFPKNPNFCNCTFNSLTLSPENCANRIGVICQPKDKLERNCTSEYFEKATSQPDKKPAKILEFYPFNDDPNWAPNNVLRSAYKQPGNSGQCLDGYKRLTANDTYWDKAEDFINSDHKYDFLAPYWMKPEKQTCVLSKVIFDKDTKTFTRTLTNEDCSKQLGFILCKKSS